MSLVSSLFSRRQTLRTPAPTTYPTFAAAAECGDGYSAADLAEFIFRRSVATANGDLRALPNLQMLATLQAAMQAPRPAGALRVLDIGGSIGGHARAVREITRLPIRWAVVETAPMVKLARELAADDLAFFEDIGAALGWVGRVDLLHLSGVLQYLADPWSLLDRTLAARPAAVLVARMAVSVGEDPVFDVQRSRLYANGHGPIPAGIPDREVRYPVAYWPECELLRRFAAADYRLTFRAAPNPVEEVAAGGLVQRDTIYFLQRRVSV